MTTNTARAFSVGAVLLLLLATTWLVLSGAERPEAGSAGTELEPPDGDAAPSSATSDRVEITSEPVPSPGIPTTLPLRGRVLDSRGQAMASVPVHLCAFEYGSNRIGAAQPTAEVLSNPMGEFELQTTMGTPVVPIAGGGFCTLRTTPNLLVPDDAEILLVAAPAVDLTGVVRGDGGAPLPGARVAVETLLLRAIPLPLGHTTSPRPAPTTTDADGRFTLPNTPLADGVDLVFDREGYRSRRVPSLEAAPGFLDVTLTKEVTGTDRIHGLAIDGSALPVQGAELRYGRTQQVHSAADGTFEFEFERRPANLVAIRPGFQPVVRERVGEDTPMPLVVELSLPSLSIAGRVVDSSGSPVPDMLINLVDPARAGMRVAVEKLSAPTRPELPDGALARSGADGRFTLGGLSNRSYRLRAYDPKTTLSVQSKPVAAGSRDVVLTVPADALLDELRGIVVTRDGHGVPGILISSFLYAHTGDGVLTLQGPLTRTDDDGRFLLRRVPRRHLELALMPDGYISKWVDIEDIQQQPEVRIELLRRCYARIEGAIGLRVSFLDEAGETLTVTNPAATMSGNGWTMREPVSPVLMLPESATTMVWSRDRKELGRRTISLEPRRESVTTLFPGR